MIFLEGYYSNKFCCLIKFNINFHIQNFIFEQKKKIDTILEESVAD